MHTDTHTHTHTHSHIHTHTVERKLTEEAFQLEIHKEWELSCFLVNIWLGLIVQFNFMKKSSEN